MKIYSDWTTDELLDELPSNLMPCRSDNAPEHDRWRIYNHATGKFVAPGYSTARELLVETFTRIAADLEAWTGSSR